MKDLEITVDELREWVVNEWHLYASDMPMRIHSNCNGTYRVTKGTKVLYIGNNIGMAVLSFNTQKEF